MPSPSLRQKDMLSYQQPKRLKAYGCEGEKGGRGGKYPILGWWKSFGGIVGIGGGLGRGITGGQGFLWIGGLVITGGL